MRAIHEYDCDFDSIGICTCGAINKCRRLGGCAGMDTHERNLKKFKALLESEKNYDATAAINAQRAADERRVPVPEKTPTAGGEPGAGV